MNLKQLILVEIEEEILAEAIVRPDRCLGGFANAGMELLDGSPRLEIDDAKVPSGLQATRQLSPDRRDVSEVVEGVTAHDEIEPVVASRQLRRVRVAFVQDVEPQRLDVVPPLPLDLPAHPLDHAAGDVHAHDLLRVAAQPGREQAGAAAEVQDAGAVEGRAEVLLQGGCSRLCWTNSAWRVCSFGSSGEAIIATILWDVVGSAVQV
ncbi:hypothetical protein ACHAWF_017065 [Thalassiosira exigua]